MKKTVTFLIILVLTAACSGLAIVCWNTAQSIAELETQLLQTQASLEEASLPEEGAEPISSFFHSLPYSGATARYLAALEADAWRVEWNHAAALLKDAGEDAAFLTAFQDFTETQAQTASEDWASSLDAQGAATAGAWAHVEEARIPPYRFGALSLISACRRAGLEYDFQFSAEQTRQILLEAGFPEDFWRLD